MVIAKAKAREHFNFSIFLFARLAIDYSQIQILANFFS